MPSFHFRVFPTLLVAIVLVGCGARTLPPPRTAAEANERFADHEIRRTRVQSPMFFIAEGDVDLAINYTGWDPRGGPEGEGERNVHRETYRMLRDTIAAARERIVISLFLFDSFVPEGDVEEDIVGELVSMLIEKKKANPDISIAVIFDISHKAYAKRMSKAERAFLRHGVDVFYSDLIIGLNRGSFLGFRETLGHVNRVIDTATFRLWGYTGSYIFSKMRIPGTLQLDGEPISLYMIYNAMLFKANHRKLMAADDGAGGYTAIVSSANPHNPSAFHVNNTLSIDGELAKYVYLVLREDAAKSIKLGELYVNWHRDADKAYKKSYLTKRLPDVPIDWSATVGPTPEKPIGAEFITESAIPKRIIRDLDAVEPGDEIRIQMFMLAHRPVVEAILRASTVVERPVRLLLDANKDSFNMEKDGTPNRQVARYLMRRADALGGQLDVRWYNTHGEQNHAKTMSISNPETGKAIFHAGSCNWTARNMAGVNMEANFVLYDADKINEKFDLFFDRFWSNEGGIEYSLPYETFLDQTGPELKWRLGNTPFYYGAF